MANDPNIRTTGRTPNDPVARPASTSRPSHTDPAYRHHEKKSSSGWMTWALIAAALVLGVMFLMPLLSDDDEVRVATNEVEVVEPVEPTAVTPAAPVVEPAEEDIVAVPEETTEQPEAETNVVTTTVPVINEDDVTVETDAVEQPTQVTD